MPVSYDSKKIIPAPFIQVTHDTLTADDGERIGSLYTIQVKGKLVAYKGSPKSDKSFWGGSDYPPDESIPDDARMNAILRKQDALRELFSVDGKSFEVSPYNGMAPIKCNPRVKRIEFAEGQWYTTCDYTITLEADHLAGFGYDDVPEDDQKVSKVSNSWNVELLDEKFNSYRLTHSVSAVGKRYFLEDGTLEKPAWKQAEDYVLQKIKLGIDAERLTAPDVLDGSTLRGFNYVRSNAVDEKAGTYAVTETWVGYDPGANPPAFHEQTVTSRYSAQDGRTVVSVEGTVTGLEVRNNTTRVFTSSRIANADSFWASSVVPHLTATANAAAAGLNQVPVSTSFGRNPAAGTITYQYEYDTRPDFNTAGALSEVITVTDAHAADVFAEVPVLGRSAGPVLQGMGTATSKRRTVSIEIVMPPKSQANTGPTAPNTDDIVAGLVPDGVQVFLADDQETWVPVTGRYSRNTVFVWQ